MKFARTALVAATLAATLASAVPSASAAAGHTVACGIDSVATLGSKVSGTVALQVRIVGSGPSQGSTTGWVTLASSKGAKKGSTLTGKPFSVYGRDRYGNVTNAGTAEVRLVVGNKTAASCTAYL
jgi:hypothetical protein